MEGVYHNFLEAQTYGAKVKSMEPKMEEYKRFDGLVSTLLERLKDDTSLPYVHRNEIASACLLYGTPLRAVVRRVLMPTLWSLKARVLNRDVKWFADTKCLELIGGRVESICYDLGMSNEEIGKTTKRVVPALSALSIKAQQALSRQVSYVPFADVLQISSDIVREISAITGEKLLQGEDGKWK